MVERRFIERYAGREKRSLIGIEDTETGMVCVTIEENIMLLNELHEENQQLKDKLDLHILLTDDERRKVSNFIKKIEEENEKLKQENEHFRKVLGKKYDAYINGKIEGVFE